MQIDDMISEAPSWKGMRTAALACPEFRDRAHADELMTAALIEMRNQGYEAVIGPMKGGTWGTYRLVLWSDGSSIFTGEPKSSPYDLEAYLRAGFEIVETHYSAVAQSGSKGFAKARPSDVTLTHWDGRDPEALLADAHGVVMQAFAGTPFFQPVPREHFIAAYLPLLAKADPRFILAARDASGRAVGFTLAFPDPVRTGAIILKTYAGLVPGIGRRMADMVHSTAAEAGFPEVVHALMRDGIVSASQSRKFGGRPIRRYALMGKLL